MQGKMVFFTKLGPEDKLGPEANTGLQFIGAAPAASPVATNWYGAKPEDAPVFGSRHPSNAAAAEGEEADNRETRELTADVVDAVLLKARVMFDQFDVDSNGVLEGEEVENLAAWVFDHFHPGGEPITLDIREKEATKLMTRHDENGDKGMDFTEFESWFKKTCVAIERFRLRG